ncbi:MAG: universal stress protein, partial [Planctomycetota bacterium]
MTEIKKILVPCDFSKESHAAMNYACMFAENTGASIDVLHVWDQPRYLESQTILQNASGQQSLLDFVKAQAEEEMKKFLAHPKRDEKIVIHKRYQLGVPHEQILDLVRKE